MPAVPFHGRRIAFCLPQCCCRTNLVIMLFFMQLSKKVPFDDPTVLNGVRAAYVLSNLIILGVYLYVGSKINAKKGSSGESTLL